MIRYEYLEKANVIKSYTSGELYSHDVLAHYDRILEDGSIQTDFVEIVDLNNLDDFILRYSDLISFESASEKLLLKGHKITLFCAFTPISSEIASMMTPVFHKVKANIHMCYSEAEFTQSKKIFLV